MQGSILCKHSYKEIVESSSRSAYSKGSKKQRPAFKLGDDNGIHISHVKKRKCKHCGKGMRYVEMRITHFKRLLQAKDELSISITNLLTQIELQKVTIASLKDVINDMKISKVNQKLEVIELEKIYRDYGDHIENLEVELQNKLALQQTLLANNEDLMNEHE